MSGKTISDLRNDVFLQAFQIFGHFPLNCDKMCANELNVFAGPCISIREGSNLGDWLTVEKQMLQEKFL